MEILSVDKKNKIISIILLVVIFLSMVMFFTLVHPMYIYDTDDWTYASWYRNGLPTFRQFNPTRVLPEILMPIISELAAKILYPITGDYIESLSWIYAIVVSLCIITYLYMMGKLMIKETKLSSKSVVTILLIILMLHFYIRPNTHMFYGANITCYFYYIIPALLNSVLVFYIIWKGKEEKSTMATGIFLLAIYLCIFSNVLNSAVLMAYTAYTLIKSTYVFIKNWTRKGKHRKAGIKDFIVENTIALFTSVLWIIAELMEINGLRASQISSEKLQISESVKSLFEYIAGIRPIVLWITFTLVIISVGVIVRDQLKNKYSEEDSTYIEALIRNIICCFLVMLYLIILCSKAGTEYLTRGDVNIDWIVFLF